MLLKELQITYSTKRVPGERPRIADAQSVYDLLCDRAHASHRERMWVVHLNTRLAVTAIEEVGVGSLGELHCTPRDIFIGALLNNSHAIILVHNHPSGDTEPSVHDIELTRRVQDAGDLLGVPLFDHIIISDDSYLSLFSFGAMEKR